MSEMTVMEKMAEARAEKDRLMRMIVTFQKGRQYSLMDLQDKNLKQLRKIYDQVMHHG